MSQAILQKTVSKSYAARRPRLKRHLLVWGPLGGMLLFAHIFLLGQFLFTPGIPRGGDMSLNMVSGYVAENGTWGQIWDDSRYPGQPKNVSRFTTSDLALTWLVRITGDLFLSIRLAFWALNIAALVGMYLFVYRVTGSRIAGALGGLVFVISRGALFQAVIAVTAGFALMPFVFLAVDRFLVSPTWRKALIAALVLALYATASIPAYTYIMGLALAVYIAAFLAFKTVSAWRKNERPVILIRLSLLGAGTLAITLLLTAYFLTGLLISTAPLADESGGYTLELLNEDLLSISEAFLYFRNLFLYNSVAIDVSIAMLAVLALFVVPILRIDFRVVAFILIALGGVFFASSIDNPIYRFMFDNLPFFSLVRGPARWSSLTLLSYSFLISIGIALALNKWRAVSNGTGNHHPVRKYGATVLAAAFIIVALLNIGTQLPGLRNWYSPYQLTSDFVAPYVWLRQSPEDALFATMPFLIGRVRGEPFTDAVDFGKTMGPGISGRQAFGVFRTGGMEVNDPILTLVEDMTALPIRQHSEVALSDSPFNVWTTLTDEPRPVKNFNLSGRLTIDEVNSPEGFAQIQFRKVQVDGEDRFYTFDLYPETSEVKFSRIGGRSPAVLAQGNLSDGGERDYDIRLQMIDNKMNAWVDGNFVLTTNATNFPSGDVLVRSEGLNARYDDLELARLPGELESDFALTRLLGLFNVKYFVVQPYTSAVERRQIDALPGLTLLGGWGNSLLYENEYYIDGKAYYTSEYGVFLGDPLALTHGMFQLDSFAQAKFPLLDISDLPEDNSSEILGKASFILIDGSGRITPEEIGALNELLASSQSSRNRPPLMHTWNLNRLDVVQGEGTPEALVLTGGDSVRLGRGKNFVLETVLLPTEGSGNIEKTEIRFRVRDESTYYYLTIDPEESLLTLVAREGARRRIIDEFETPLNGQLPIRLAAIEEDLSLYLNDEKALSIKDFTIDKGGPVDILPGNAGITILSPRLSSGDTPVELLKVISEQGLSLSGIVNQSGDVETEGIARLGFSQVFAADVKPLVASTYRLVILTSGDRQPSIEVWLDDGVGARDIQMDAPTRPDGSWIHPPGSSDWLVISEPFALSEKDAKLVLASRGTGAKLAQMLLIEAPEAIVSSPILDSQPPSGLQLNRDSATKYTANMEVNNGGVLVFEDAYHNGWKASVNGNQTPHIQVFGALNGYWVSQESAGESELKLEFSPQTRYSRALALSGLTFLLVIGALALPFVWRRWVAPTETGKRLDARTREIASRIDQRLRLNSRAYERLRQSRMWGNANSIEENDKTI